jgi:hydrogenase-4 component B
MSGVILGGSIVLKQEIATLSFTTSMPLFDISLRFDMLAGFFILLIGTVGLASSLYGISYMRQFFDKYNIGVFGFFYNLFLLSLILVVTASNAFYFLFVWEIMSLTSLFLVLFEFHHSENVTSGILYFVMTHVGSICILAAFLLLYNSTQTFDFWTIKSLAATIPNWVKDSVFILMLIGFGTKAGMIPFHIWLPKAHSASPSHVSALMSGVMIKMGIFMFFRLFLEILPIAPFWWGAVVLVLGALSSLLGVLYALSEHDIKRLLAYHSIENIGIILLGLGSSMIFLNLHMSTLALLAASAALFHTFNHAVFKSLLFLGAGSVISATGTRNLEKYGGLIKCMPYTAVFFLIGAIAISGLPPFNGFASEWVTFQSLFAGINSSVLSIRVLFIFAGGCLALTGGLAAACFVKAFGITFLARPRSTESEKAKEASGWMLWPMVFLASLCLVIGVGAGGVLQIIRQVLINLGSFGAKVLPVNEGMTITVQDGFAQLNMPIILLSMIATTLFVYLLSSWVNRRQKVTRDVTWDCGYIGLLPHTEITATAFSRSLILIFKGIFQPTSQDQIEYIDAKICYLTRSHTVNLVTENIYEKYFYDPLNAFITRTTKQIKRLQGGNLNQYLLYVFITLIGLLIWVRYY